MKEVKLVILAPVMASSSRLKIPPVNALLHLNGSIPLSIRRTFRSLPSYLNITQSVHIVFRTFFYDFVQYVTSVSSHEVVFVYLCKRQQDRSEIYCNQQRNGTGQDTA